MDEQTGEKTLKTCWLIICFSVGSHRGRTDGRTDRPSYRDAFLTDASKNGKNNACI